MRLLVSPWRLSDKRDSQVGMRFSLCQM